MQIVPSEPNRDALPRRAFLGAELAPDGEAFSEEGVLVVGVVPGGMAFAAGVKAGDRLVSIGGKPLRSLCEIAFALRYAGKQVGVDLIVERAGQTFAEKVVVQPCASEAMAGQEVSYGSIQVDGARLRSILTRPLVDPPRGAILFLQGIACESVDYGAGSEEPIAQLLNGWARAGYATMRVDKRGVGDSEGAACPAGDFATELADHRAALYAMASEPHLQGLDLYLFGHSIGGMVAPILASERAVQGLMVYGTSTKTWLECVVASTRRQYEMRGVAAAEIAAILASLRERVDREGLNGRCAAYHRQLDALDLPTIWKSVQQTRVLVLCGENDWVLSRAEQMEIATFVESTEVMDLPGLDHMLGWHASRADSLSAYGQGRFEPAILQATLEWLGRPDIESIA